jgi:SOS-response transcriptional repressor LexA
MTKLTFKETLSLLRKRKGLTQGELAEKAGILREMICNYESGKMTPRGTTLRKIALALGVDFDELNNLILEEKKSSEQVKDETHLLFRREEEKLQYVETISDIVTLPVLGKVHAGDPNLISEQEIIDLIKLPRRIGRSADYALEISGISMIEAGINKGDTVTVKIQPYADNGDIVIARIGEDYTIKRLRKDETGEVWLEPANSHYQAIKGKDFEIVGVITYMLRKFK